MPGHGDDHHLDEHDLGLAHDLSTLLDRRRALKVLAGAALLSLAACGGDGDEGASPSSPSSTAPGTTSGGGSPPSTHGGAGATCQEIPGETAGPFPGNGANGPNVLDDSGIVRRDITSSLGSSTRAEGVPLTVNLVIQDQANGCRPLAGAAVYVWHCSREGLYSLYSPGATGQNYLRGVQEADADGRVAFTSIFPGCYPGRWPHIHFEVYPSLARATTHSSRTSVSQLALPEDACQAAYATTGYEASARNLAGLSLARDGVFRDGYARQLATVSGSAGAGYSAELSVPV